MIRVVVVGARGKMGQEVVKAVIQDEATELVGAVDRTMSGMDVAEIIGGRPTGVQVHNRLSEVLDSARPDVMVDFTTPDMVRTHVDTAISFGVRPVVGTTGLMPADIQEWDALLRDKKMGGVIAPNFTIGAILMMKFAAMAAKHLPHVEIIEMHHDRKLDSPSGTAMKTLEMIAAERDAISQGHPDEKETLAGARGGEYDGMRVHSVRLPGYFAHQEVLLGGNGQVLSIRHDSMSRTAYMPGVLLAVKRVVQLEGLIYGLEHLLE